MLPKPVGVSLDLNDDGMMEQSVEERRSDDVVTKEKEEDNEEEGLLIFNDFYSRTFHSATFFHSNKKLCYRTGY